MFDVACSDSDLQAVSDTEWHRFRYYDSETCRRMPNQMYGNVIMISDAYLLWDLLRLVLFEKTWTRLNWEHFYHHVISIVGISGTMVCGHGAPSIAANLLLTEVPSIFLALKNLLPPHYHKKSWFPLILAGVVISFTYFRVWMAPFSLRNTYNETAFFW